MLQPIPNATYRGPPSGWSNCTWSWTIGWLTNCIKIAISAARRVHVRHYVCFPLAKNCGRTPWTELWFFFFSFSWILGQIRGHTGWRFKGPAIFSPLYVCVFGKQLSSCSGKSHDDFNALSCSLGVCSLCHCPSIESLPHQSSWAWTWSWLEYATEP